MNASRCALGVSFWPGDDGCFVHTDRPRCYPRVHSFGHCFFVGEHYMTPLLFLSHFVYADVQPRGRFMIHGGENSLKKKKRKRLLGVLRASIPGGEMRPGGRRDLHSFPAHSSCRLPADPTHSPLLPAPHATLPG